nr:hypothetical protein BN993_03227 [Virgibacillus halodenitrificans]
MRISCLVFCCALPFLASGCDGEAGWGGDKPTELKPTTEFSTSIRPALDAKHLVSAALSGSGMALEREPGDNPPQYADLEFFPILSADGFKKIEDTSYGHSRSRLPDLSGIDFNKNFVFLVAYPSSDSYRAAQSGQQALFFTKVQVTYPDDEVALDLSASHLGNMDIATMLSGSWKGELYVVERRDRDQLEVNIDDNTYRYSLNDENG